MHPQNMLYLIVGIIKNPFLETRLLKLPGGKERCGAHIPFRFSTVAREEITRQLCSG